MGHAIVFFCAIYALANVQYAESISQYPKLLVVSYDGFTHDYFDRNVTKFMSQLKKDNTYADRMINAFVTKTFPNHHTIATGFFVENHGVIDSEVMVDNRTIGNSAELFQYNANILPIWTLNELSGNGRHSGVIMWPGSQFAYNGKLPAFVETFNLSIPWEDRVDLMVSWFTDPSTPINFGVLYIEEPDFHGHAYGINAPIMNEMLKKLDNITKYLYDKLEENNLKDVNVVHLSDHGMVSVSLDRVINLTSYIGDTGYQAIEKNTIMLITPDHGNEDIIYSKLKAAASETSKFQVYRREEIPKRYHFSNNPRIGDILVSANNGYAFEGLLNNLEYYKEFFNITVTNQSEFGVHGYDNEDANMQPIFFARGPAFVRQCELEPFDSVDLFPLFCKILDMKCNATNGTLQVFSKCLTPSAGAHTTFGSSLVIGFLCLIAIVTINGVVIYLIRRRRDRSRLYNRRLYNEHWDENQENF